MDARGRVRLVAALKTLDFFWVQVQVERGNRVRQVVRFRSSDDRTGHFGLIQHPRQGDLGRVDASAGGQIDDGVDDGTVALGVGVAGELVAARAVGLFVPRAGEEAPRQRAPRYACDALVGAERKHLPLFFAV